MSISVLLVDVLGVVFADRTEREIKHSKILPISIEIDVSERKRYLHTVKVSTTPIRAANTTRQIAQVNSRHAKPAIFFFLIFFSTLDKITCNVVKLLLQYVAHLP